MIGGSLDEHGADALASLRARFDAAHERVSDLYESAKGSVVDGAKRTDKAIRANPYRSLLVATGIGVLVGVLLSRRKR